MEFKNYTFDYFINLIEENKHFTLTKIGDGELISIFKSIGWLSETQFGTANADRHRYYKELGISLHNTLINEKGYYKYFHPGWLNSTINDKNLCKLLQKYVETYKISPPNLCDSRNAFYVDVKNGNLSKLKKVLEERNFIVVSEKRKKNIPIKYKDFITTPLTNSWLSKEEIKEGVLNMVEKYENPIFGLSIGMPSLVIQDELYPLIGENATMINFGSIWDPFINVYSRRYHHTYKTLKL
jgi:hypothetical protein